MGWPIHVGLEKERYVCVGRGMIHGYKRDENRRILRIK